MVCSVSAPLPNGVLRYAFAASDDEGATASGAPTGTKAGPTLAGPPQLWCTGLSGMTADFLAPNTGSASKTQFTFAAQYTDSDGEAPSVNEVVIQKEGKRGAWSTVYTKVMSLASGTPTTGAFYTWEMTLPEGKYRFRFAFQDPGGSATGSDSNVADSTQWQSGPTVTKSRGAPHGAQVTTLSAVRTPGGAEIVFVLSRAACVDARIVNLAGRLVRRLATARPAARGANSLLWDGCAEGGLEVPAGTYLVEVTACDARGTSVRAIAPLRLDR